MAFTVWGYEVGQRVLGLGFSVARVRVWSLGAGLHVARAGIVTGLFLQG